jgi:hypothetical protein
VHLIKEKMLTLALAAEAWKMNACVGAIKPEENIFMMHVV